MYIALVPERPRFEEEHLTLVWCGNEPLAFQWDEARILTNEINSAIKHPANRTAISVVSGWETFGRKRVAVLDVPHWLWSFRQKAEGRNLDVSLYHSWRPHISAMPGHRPRPVNSVVRFTHAEVR